MKSHKRLMQSLRDIGSDSYLPRIIMRDTLGNSCRVTMHCFGKSTFEVYFHRFNDDVPNRVVANRERCLYLIDLWVLRKIREGFKIIEADIWTEHKWKR